MNRYRNFSSNPLSTLLSGSVVTQIVIANAVVFVIGFFVDRSAFIRFFGLTPALVATRGYVWQLVTYMFLHGDFWHIFFNMFVIWMLGSQLEAVWGSARFLRFYLACGLGGALSSFLFSWSTPVIGASAADYGILVAYAMLFPYNELYVWGLFPVRARTLAIFIAVVEFVSEYLRSDGIAHFAHLGGMAAGFIYVRMMYRSWRRRRGDGDGGGRFGG